MFTSFFPYLSIYLSIYLSNLTVYLNIDLFIYLFIYLLQMKNLYHFINSTSYLFEPPFSRFPPQINTQSCTLNQVSVWKPSSKANTDFTLMIKSQAMTKFIRFFFLFKDIDWTKRRKLTIGADSCNQVTWKKKQKKFEKITLNLQKANELNISCSNRFVSLLYIQ